MFFRLIYGRAAGGAEEEEEEERKRSKVRQSERASRGGKVFKSSARKKELARNLAAFI